MKKKCIRGFTLIELIISMAILTIVIFTSYSMINNINFMFSKQLNTTNNQVSANDLNKYLSRDIQYSVNINGPIFLTNKSDGSKYTLNNIDKNDEVNYEYKITTNENKEVVYIVSIKHGKYSIYRNDYNGVSLNFIDNNKLIEEGNNLKAPLVIEESSENELLYAVNLNSMDKKYNEYSFQVASRHQSGSISGNIGSDNGGDNQGSNESPGSPGGTGGNQGSTENPDGSGSTISNKNLVFEYKKLNKNSYNEDYQWEHKVTFNLNGTKSNTSHNANKSLFSDTFVIRRYGEEIQAYNLKDFSGYVSTNDTIVKNIKGFRLKFDDGIKIKNIKFMSQGSYEDLDNSNKVYTFKLDNNIQNIGYGELLTGCVDIEDSKLGDIYKIEIEFIY